MLPQEQGHEIRPGEFIHGRQRGGGGQRIHFGNIVGILRHGLGEGEHHAHPAHQSRVDEVAAQTAEQHLDDDDGNEIPYQQLPDGHPYRDGQCQQHARDHGGKITYGRFFLHQAAPEILQQHAVEHGNSRKQQRPPAEDGDGRNEGRAQRDANAAHDGTGILFAADMRGDAEDQLFHLFSSFFIWASCSCRAFSFSACAFSLTCQSRSIPLASLLTCTRGL